MSYIQGGSYDKDIIDMSEDFISGNATVDGAGIFSINSTGTTPTWNTSEVTSAHPGVIRLNITQEDTSGIMVDSSSIELGGGIHRFRALIKLSNLQTPVPEYYTARIGFGNTTLSGAVTDGAYFQFSLSQSNWVARTIASSTNTAELTGVEATTDWTLLEVYINQAASQVDFYINGIKTNDITTNIPATTTALDFGVTIEKDDGDSDRYLYIDKIRYQFFPTTDRGL